jgi:hypothetical protein
MAARPLTPAAPGEIHTGLSVPGIEAWRYKSDMYREKNKEYFLKHSGDLSNTNDVHRAMRSGLLAMHNKGLNCKSVIDLLDEKSRLQPDKDGESRKEAMQLMEEGAVIIPGVGSFGGRAPELEPGWFTRQWRKVWGEPK